MIRIVALIRQVVAMATTKDSLHKGLPPDVSSLGQGTETTPLIPRSGIGVFQGNCVIVGLLVAQMASMCIA